MEFEPSMGSDTGCIVNEASIRAVGVGPLLALRLLQALLILQ